jgi:hypothetical protein
MKLTIMERSTLLALLPQEGGLSTMRPLNDLRTALFLTPAESKKWGVEDREPCPTCGAQARTSWKENGEATVEVGEIMKAVVVKVLTDIEKAEKLRVEYLSLWDKFIEGK